MAADDSRGPAVREGECAGITGPAARGISSLVLRHPCRECRVRDAGCCRVGGASVPPDCQCEEWRICRRRCADPGAAVRSWRTWPS